MNVVSYARYSSDNQREESIEAQEMYINKFCAERGYTIIRQYRDKALSGRSAKRPQFQQMFEDAKNHEFEAIIIHKLDRFSRNLKDYINYTTDLEQKYGVKVISINDPFDDNPSGRLARNMMANLNQYFSENLSIEVKKGFAVNANKCMHNGGKPPLGYRVSADHKYEIEENDALIVTTIYDLFLKGYSYDKIHRHLLENNMETLDGRIPKASSIHDILINEKYTGTYIYNRTEEIKQGQKRNSRKSKDEKDIIRIENGMPIIIPRPEWEKVQTIMYFRKRRTGTFKATQLYLASGNVYCEKCGSKMYGDISYYGLRKDGTRKKVRVYSCNNKNCSNVVVADKLDIYLVNLIKHICNTIKPGQIEKELQLALLGVSTTEKFQIRSLEKKQRSLEKSINDAVEKLIITDDLYITEKLNANITEKRNELSKTNEKLKELKKKTFSYDKANAFIKSYVNGNLTNIDSMCSTELHQLVKLMVNQISINNESIRIQMNLDTFLNGEQLHLNYILSKSVIRNENFEKIEERWLT